MARGTPDPSDDAAVESPLLTMGEWLDSLDLGSRRPLTRTEDNLRVLNELRDENG